MIQLDGPRPQRVRIGVELARATRRMWVARARIELSYRIVRAACRPVAGLCRPTVSGLEHVPSDGPLIVASNHLSAIDTLFLSVLLKRRVTFLAKAEYFTRPGLRGRLMSGLMSACGFVPVDRASPAAGRAAIHSGLQVLASGGVFGVYPEGARSMDGRLYRGRTGIARLALESGAAVLPVALVGTSQVLPPGGRLPRLHRVQLRIGQPMRFVRDETKSLHDRTQLRVTTEQVMKAIHDLSGQERVDSYARTGSSRQRPASQGLSAL
jgi:1-acyl-sn-glycerol-3-phosphate acyltransferase